MNEGTLFECIRQVISINVLEGKSRFYIAFQMENNVNDKWLETTKTLMNIFSEFNLHEHNMIIGNEDKGKS